MEPKYPPPWQRQGQWHLPGVEARAGCGGEASLGRMSPSLSRTGSVAAFRVKIPTLKIDIESDLELV